MQKEVQVNWCTGKVRKLTGVRSAITDRHVQADRKRENKGASERYIDRHKECLYLGDIRGKDDEM